MELGINAGQVLPGNEARQGWPWDRELPSATSKVAEGGGWPRITVVTPSYKQGRFIETTIRSILLQSYPNLEYVIIDGGSTDGTIDIIKKYEPWITRWVSEPDRGMYDAINKGFARATGDIMAWSNTDDVYLPGAFRTIGSVFRQFPEVQWLTSLHKVQWDENGRETKRYKVKGFNRRAFYRGSNLLGRNRYATYMIQQQSTFWRRSLWDQSGSRVADDLQLAGDFELWTRFYKFAKLYALDEPLGVFRFQSNQKTARFGQEYLREAEEALGKAGGKYPGKLAGWLRARLLSRIPSRWLCLLAGISYPTSVIERENQSRRWTIGRRYFA